MFGICRGFQEMNVAFGGTLHQKLHEVPGFLDHRDDETQPLDVQYGPAHDVVLEPGGLLRALRRARTASESIRCTRRAWTACGSDLVVEARAPDGVIEAFRVQGRAALRARGAMAPRVEGDEQRLSRARCSPPSAHATPRTRPEQDNR